MDQLPLPIVRDQERQCREIVDAVVLSARAISEFVANTLAPVLALAIKPTTIATVPTAAAAPTAAATTAAASLPACNNISL